MQNSNTHTDIAWYTFVRMDTGMSHQKQPVMLEGTDNTILECKMNAFQYNAFSVQLPAL